MGRNGFCLSCFLLLIWPVIGMRSGVPTGAESELLALHAADRRAHFAHDVDGLLAHVAEEIVDVRDGNVRRVTREQLRARFQQYFSTAEFTAWDDVAPPIVQVSPDGRMAWMIVKVRIAYSARDTEKTDETMAWMSAYEKRNGIWVLTAVTTTSQKL